MTFERGEDGCNGAVIELALEPAEIRIRVALSFS
jgi:hypothetical protein